MEQQPDASPLFVAATRPAMLLGLPIGLFILLTVAFALIMILIENPFYEAIMIPAWFGARVLTRYDYNAVRVVMLWGQTKGRSFDAHHWGGASPAPFPVRPPKSARGIPDAR